MLFGSLLDSRSWAWWLVLLAIAWEQRVSGIVDAQPLEFHIGALAPVTSLSQGYLGIVAAFAIDLRKNFEPDLQEQLGPPVIEVPNLHPDLRVRVTVGTSHSEAVAIDTLWDWMSGESNASRMIGFVGAHYSSVSMPVASLAGVRELPQISHASTNPLLSNKAQYPFFMRTISSDHFTGAGMWLWMKEFNVPSVAFTYTEEPYGTGLFQVVLLTAAEEGRASRIHGISLPRSDLNASFRACTQIREAGSKFVMMAMADTATVLMYAMEQEGLLYGSHQFLAAMSAIILENNPYKPSRGFPAGWQGLWAASTGPLLDRFADLWTQLTPEDMYGELAYARFQLASLRVPLENATAPKFTDRHFASVEELTSSTSYSTLFFDSLYTYVFAINALLNDGVDVEDIKGARLLEQLQKTRFQGISGDISFDPQGDRLGRYILWNAWPDGNGTNTTTFHPVGTMAAGSLTLSSAVRWAPNGAAGVLPPDALYECSEGFARDTTTNVCLPCNAGIGCGYRVEDGIPLGVSVALDSDAYGQEFLAIVASADIELRKNFDPALRERFGEPVIDLGNVHPSLKLRLQVGTSNSQISVGMSTALDWLLGSGDFSQVAGMVFGYYSSIAIPVASVATALKTPMMGYASTSPTLSDKRRYEFFLRTVGPDTIAGEALWRWAERFSIAPFVCMYSQEAYGEGFFQSVVSAAAANGRAQVVRGLGVPYFAGVGVDDEVAASVQEAVGAVQQLGIRFVVMAMLPEESPVVLWAFEQASLLYGDGAYQIVSSEITALEGTTHGWTPSRGLPLGMQSFRPSTRGPLFDAWMQSWHNLTLEDIDGREARARYMLDYTRISDNEIAMFSEDYFVENEPHGYAALLFDAIFSFISAINTLLNEGVAPADIHGSRLLEALHSTSFEGVSGRVAFNEDGDRVQRLELFNLFQDSGAFQLVGIYDQESQTLEPAQVGESFAIMWAGGHISEMPPSSLAIQCAPGTSFEAAQGNCASCASGWFSTGGHNAECRLCPPGSTSSYAAAACQLCPVGTYTELAGSKCTPCPVGSFASSNGSVSCALCAVGEYSDVVGASECVHCSDANATSSGETTMARLLVNGGTEYNYVVGADSPSLCGCDRGQQNASNNCAPCSEGMVCPGLGDVFILPGYYAESPQRLSVYKCFGDYERCIGGTPGDNCAAGRRGITCSQCEDRMTPASGGKCEPCGDFDTLPFALLVLLLACGLLFIYKVSRGGRSKGHQSLSLVLCATAAGHLLSVMQQMAVVGLLSLSWEDPFKSYLEAISVLMFDIKMLKLSCVSTLSSLETYVLKLSILLVAIATMGSMHFAVVAIFHKCKFWKHRWVLVSAVSILLITFYIMVSTIILEPLQCKEHPNDKWTVWAYQSVVCWESETHHAMLGVGFVAFCLVPIGFLAAVVKIVSEFPRRMQRADWHFVRAFSFLFFRFKPGRQWFLIVHMAKSLLIACCLVVPDTVMQLFLLESLLFAGFAVTLVVRPWRAPLANALDQILSVVMHRVVSIASFFIQDEYLQVRQLSWTCLILLNAGLALIPAAIVYGLYRKYLRQSKTFDFFLCHYKAASGAYTRLLKMHLLMGRQRGDVFIDSDNLDNLDHLFEYIRSDTRTVVIIATGEIFTRTWCVGEMTTARIAKVDSVLLTLPTCHLPDAEFLTNLEIEGLPNFEVLAESGMDMSMIAYTMLWVATLPTVDVPATISHTAMQTTVAKLHGKESVSSSNDVLRRGRTSGTLIEHRCFAMYDTGNMEAAAACHVLRMLLTPLMSHSTNLIPDLLDGAEDLPVIGRKLVVVMCTNGAFENDVFLEQLAWTELSEYTRFYPVLAESTFRFPPQDVLRWLQMLNLPSATDEVVRKAAHAISVIFKEIATAFQPHHASISVLTVNAKEVSRRIALHASEVTASDPHRGLNTPTSSKHNLRKLVVASNRPEESQSEPALSEFDEVLKASEVDDIKSPGAATERRPELDSVGDEVRKWQTIDI